LEHFSNALKKAKEGAPDGALEFFRVGRGILLAFAFLKMEFLRGHRWEAKGKVIYSVGNQNHLLCDPGELNPPMDGFMRPLTGVVSTPGRNNGTVTKKRFSHELVASVIRVFKSAGPWIGAVEVCDREGG